MEMESEGPDGSKTVVTTQLLLLYYVLLYQDTQVNSLNKVLCQSGVYLYYIDYIVNFILKKKSCSKYPLIKVHDFIQLTELYNNITK
jgi:hypothetical protein